MASRIDLIPTLRCLKASGCRPTSTRLFSSSSPLSASTVTQRRRQQDPYAQAQARARRAANISKQEVLSTQRAKALGDPVRGITTPFVRSFDDALDPRIHKDRAEGEEPSQNLQQEHLNYFVSRKELQESIENSKELSLPRRSSTPGDQRDPAEFERKVAQHEVQHQIAQEALSRITAIENSSDKDRLRINVQRCIDTFGRHNTDAFLAPKPSREQGLVEKTPRAGVDTGSSEVQIAILTAKIRAVANFLETRGQKDVVNKRNLRLLVHRRQKLLKYLHRKERGGERWQNLIAKLGLTEGTYKGEISL